MTDEIRDNTALGRFEMAVNGDVAIVTYRQTKSATILVHSEVPKELQGRGFGTKLVTGVLDLLRGQGRKVVVICPFIAAFIRKHSEYKAMLAAPLRDTDHEKLDARLDEALAETFPASDPPAVTPER